MENQPKRSDTLSPLLMEEERFLPLTPTELRAASRAMAFAYEADRLPVAESNALISAHFKVACQGATPSSHDRPEPVARPDDDLDARPRGARLSYAVTA